MIKIIISKTNNSFERIQIMGHAGYENAGKDIVCAGVSSILTTSVNAILAFDNEAIIITEDNPFLLKVLKQDKITKTLIENMISLFKELEQTYPKNINIREDETNE